jgi:hypothetical protein
LETKNVEKRRITRANAIKKLEDDRDSKEAAN